MIEYTSSRIVARQPIGTPEDLELCRHGFESFAFVLRGEQYRSGFYDWLTFANIISNFCSDIRTKCVADAMRRVVDSPDSTMTWVVENA